jgi:ABC-type lipoprotein release transport system permease subunit
VKRLLRVIAPLALRNLRRHLRRTVLSALAMILGGGLLIFSLSLGDGLHEDWVESAVRMGSGHVTLQHPDFQRSRKLQDRLAPEERATALEALARQEVAEQLRSVAPRLSVNGLASSPSGARPAQIVGVDPEAEAAFNIVDERLLEGRYLEPGDRLAAYVGTDLARSLELRLGSRLVVTAQDARGEIAGQLVRVTGIFRTGVPEVDESLVHVPLRTTQSWLGAGESVTEVAVLLDSSLVVPAVSRLLARELAERPSSSEVSVLGWREAMPVLDAAVRIDEFGNYMFHGILFTIIALGIVNTVLMSVLHRHREFGVLQALGLTPRQTGSLVLTEGLVLTVVSGVIGIALGLLVTWYFFGNGLDITGAWDAEWSFSGVVMDPVIVPIFRTARMLQSLVFLLLVGGFASLYPALRASRIDVTEAMKFER